MSDTLRQQLAADGLVGPQAALILALAGDMPASATVWSSSATVAELATRLSVSARTVQRHRAALPTLHYLSISSTARGYLLRIDLSDGALSPLPDPRQDPAKVPPVTPLSPPPYGDAALTAEVLDEIVGWVAQVAAILGDRVPLPPALAALCHPLVTPAKGVTKPRQIDDKATTDRRQTPDIPPTDPRQEGDTDASHTRGEIVRTCAPVSDRSTPYSRTAFSQQASRAHAHAHEGAEGGQDDLAAWLTEALVDRLGQLVRRVTAIEPGDIEELGAQLLDRLGDPLVVRRLIEDRVLSLRSREIAARPESWAQLMRWLLDDASNPTHVARATAAASAPALAAELAAQPHIAPAPSRPQRREPFRAPQFGEVYAEAAARKAAAQAQPVAPPTASSPSTLSAQERAELVEQLASELSMPAHYRSAEAIAYLVDALGAEGQRMIAEASGESVSAEVPHPPRPTQAPRPVPQAVEVPHPPRPTPQAAELPQLEEPPLTPATGGLPAAIRDQLAALHIAPPSGKIDAPRVDPERLWARCLQALSRLHSASARGWLTRLEGAPVLIDRHRRVISVELTASEVDAWCSIDHITTRVAVGEALETAGARDWRVEVVTPAMGVA